MNIILLGIPGLLVWLIQMAWIPFWAAGIINGVGHRYGYRNFETNDSSTNIIPWGFFIGGEELHNNHHAFGTSAKFSIKWWEFDIGWLYIKILSFLGLAQVKRKFSLLEKTETPHPIDFNLLRIITTNRLQILTHFCRQVIEPVFHEEQKHHQFSANEKKILLTPDVLLDPVIDQKRTEILNKSSAINTVYQFKISLQKIWGNTALHSDDMVNLLKQWVSAAQNSDNIWLNRFTTNLHYY